MAQIMVVTRSTDERRDLVARLKDDGHHVHAAEDGGSALELIKVLKPGIVIMDIDLPNLDGLTVLKELRRSSVTKALPVILMGASERAAVRSTATQLGVVDYLIRPFTIDDVMLRVNWALKETTTVPAVPWDMTDVNLRQFLSDPEKGPEPLAEISPLIINTFERMASDAGLMPGAGISMMTPQKGGSVETEDGIVRVDVPPGSVRSPMSLGAARSLADNPPLSQSIRVRMGRRLADLTFIDQTGAPIGGPKLDRPVKISIKYDQRDLAEAGDAEKLTLARYLPDREKWARIPSEVDMKNQWAFAWQKDFRLGGKLLRGKILIADGEGDELEELVDTIKGAGFSVIIEPDGLAVARRVDAEQPDVVLVDLSLPRLDGVQVLRQIKGDPRTRSAPVILFGESDDRNLQASLMTMGVRELIVKPWQPGDVQRRVKRAYDSARASKRQQQRAFDRLKARQAYRRAGAQSKAARPQQRRPDPRRLRKAS